MRKRYGTKVWTVRKCQGAEAETWTGKWWKIISRENFTNLEI